jgi:hypothetical protein
MKYFILSNIFILFFSFLTLEAKELSVDSLLQRVKQSSASQRRVAINQLKVALKKMSQERREKIMLQLQSSLREQSVLSSPDTAKRVDATISHQLTQGTLLGHTSSISSRVRTSPIKTTHRGGK